MAFDSVWGSLLCSVLFIFFSDTQHLMFLTSHSSSSFYCRELDMRGAGTLGTGNCICTGQC